MDELPVEFRKIRPLRHQEDLSYKEIGDILQNSYRHGYVATGPGTRQSLGNI